MRQVPLYRRDGSVRAHALVDDRDYDEVTKYRWYWNAGYACRREPEGGPKVYLHRQVMQPGEGMEVDHRDGDTLNCRRENLRVVTHAQNQQNRAYGYGYSNHRGVSWHKRRKQWLARAKVGGTTHFLGWFADEEDAAQAAADFRAEHMPFSAEAA